MEVFITKTLFIIGKFVMAVSLILYGIFFDKKTFFEVIHDEQVQTGIDIFYVSLYSYFAYVRLFCGGITPHTFFENIVFYVGGFLGLAWAFYRFLAQREDYKSKKKINDFQKKVFEEAEKK